MVQHWIKLYAPWENYSTLHFQQILLKYSCFFVASKRLKLQMIIQRCFWIKTLISGGESEYYFCIMVHVPRVFLVKVSQWRKITIIFEWFIVLMWKYLNFQLFCFCYSVVNVGSAFTEAQLGSTLTVLCFESVYSLLRKIVERGFQILTLINFHEPLEIKCNFQRPSSSDSPLRIVPHG